MSNEYRDSGPDRASGNLSKYMAIVMVLLAMVGAAVTLADATWSRTYWLTLVPIFGLMCIIAAWNDTRALDRMVVRQILHWLSVGLAIMLDFNFLRGRGEQTAAATGLSSLLILALVTPGGGCPVCGSVRSPLPSFFFRRRTERFYHYPPSALRRRKTKKELPRHAVHPAKARVLMRGNKSRAWLRIGAGV